MKNINISGNIGKDAEVRRTSDGTAVAGFTVAVKDRQDTVWFDVSIWGKRGETLAQYLTKGSAVSVSGDLGTREYNGKTYLTVRANEVTLLGGKRRDDSPQSYGGAPAGGEPAGRIHDPLDEDTIPFAPQVL